MKKYIILLLLIAIAFMGFADNNIVINTSHIRQITSMEYSDQRQLLFTGSEDGSIKIWDTWTNELTNTLTISHMPILDIAVHPIKPYLAILEVFGTDSSVISVWNWERNIKLYTIDTTSNPLSMDFSSLGNYLYYCIPEWESIKFHNAENGTPIQLIQNNFGIVSFLIFSRTEKNLMTYKPSGNITFRDISTNEIILDINTVSNLSNINISGDRNYLVGTSDSSVLLIDILSGAILDELEIENVINISISNNNIMCHSKFDSKSNISYLKILSSKMIFISNPSIQLDENEITAATIGKDKVFFGGFEGNINILTYTGNLSTFAENNILEITGIDIKDEIIAIASSEGIFVLRLDISNILYSNDQIINSNTVSNIIRNPFSEAIGLSFINDSEKIMIWDKSSSNGIAILDIENNTIENENINFSSPIVQLSYFEDNITVLDRNGRIQMFSMPDFNNTYNYFSPGINKILSISERALIGVQTNQSQHSGSLLHINPANGETFSIPGTSLYSYECIYDPVHDRLFSISIEKTQNDSIITAIKLHYGQSYENEEIIKQYWGEDISASIAYEPIENRLYTSLGFDAIQVWDPSGIYKSTFETSNHIPRNILISENLLISNNLDSSITVWNRRTQKILFDLYLFKDFSWIAVNSDSVVNASSGAYKYLVEN